MPDVITLGDINIDIVAPILAYPAQGGDTVSEQASLHTGGSAANTAMALAGLELEVGCIGRVGQDALGTQVLVDLEDAGVDTRLVQFDPAVSTGVIFIAVTPDGERTMFGARGANSYTDPQLLVEDYFVGARWFHFSGYALLAEPQRLAVFRALELAVKAGCHISFDAGVEPSLRVQIHIQRLLPRIDVILPSEMELFHLTGSRDWRQGALQLLEQGVGAVVTKRGANGSQLTAPHLEVSLPAFKIAPLDTTGAGDCFNAGFILGRLGGLGWEAAAVLGSASGALATQMRGAAAGRIGRKTLCHLIEEHLSAPEWLELHEALQKGLTFLEA